MSTPVRTATVVAAWLGAVVAATALGLTAVNAIGAGIVGAGQQVLGQEEVAARLAAAPAPLPPATTTPTTEPPPTTAGADRQVVSSRGGIVVGRCVDGRPVIVSTTPAQGFGVHGDDGGEDSGDDDGDDDSSGRGSGDGPQVRFEDGELRVELRLACVGGRLTGTEQIDD